MHHHHISQTATRAMDRWRYLAFEGLSWSRVRARPRNLDVVENFTAAYRRSATELARVRAFSPDKRLADFIEQGVATAHFAVYRRKRPTLRQVVEGALFGVPAAVQKLWKYHTLSLLITVLTTAISFTAVTAAPETYYLFVDRELASGRDPSASREYLAEGLGPQDSALDEGMFFSGYLFTHNTQVAFLCFAWGFLIGLPTIYLLAKNGLMLGAFLGLFFSKGLGVEAVAWLGPHGVPEIGAIILCGGAGMAIGHRLLNPGKLPRRRALTLTATDASIVALGCVPLLMTAGVIEGLFRQSHAGLGLRYGLMAVMFVSCTGWLFFVRRRTA
ncbi:MAG: stage II sporulation protein M [Planctomycetes bacterium]|nr:stage II sporulation protein M [Planctomycetota bacterium]MCB9935341.1 stage II sporulation protein M [Planctomycetota bacterium]